MKYTEYIVKFTETVISPEVQFKCSFLESRIFNSATMSPFHGALAPRSGAFNA